MKKIIAVCLTLAMLCSFAACGQSADRRKFEGEGFDTPEEAVTAYLEAMKAGDVEGMISTFAVETYVDYFILAEQIDKSHTYDYRNMMLAPIDDRSKSLNVGQKINSLYTDFLRQYMYLTNTDSYEDVLYLRGVGVGENKEFSSGEEFLAFLMDPDWMKELSKLQLISMEDVEIKFEHNRYIQNEKTGFSEYKKGAEDRYGCQEVVYRIAEFKLNGENYHLFMELACYDGKWYNITAGGISGQLGIDVYGGMILAEELN